MNISFERDSEIGRELRTLPAEHYRKIHLLFTCKKGDSLFVPIRSMQYLGIIDRDEIVFIDGQGPRVIELSWCDFQSTEREDLRAPVTYTCIYYAEKGREIMIRLQSEFLKALELIQIIEEAHARRARTRGWVRGSRAIGARIDGAEVDPVGKDLDLEITGADAGHRR